MGGGSMGIRAAARAAFIGGYRSASNARRSALPSSSAAAADTRPVSTATTFDDWYIPDREVFGPVPSHEEAMAATLDLRDATKVAQETFQDHLHSEASKHEEKHDSLSVASGSSARVIEAFTMLHESPEAQDVVASLASDKNVWEAVMKNKKLVEFYKTNLSESSSVTDEAEQSDAESSQSSNGVVSPADAFSDYIQMMKAFVSEMVTNLSSIMQDLVATSDEGQSKGRLKTLIINSKKDFTNGPSSFVLLAIASILVVLLKRA
ncbi:unnamed protein product [Triticum turgidum subsp. durum]|uniref:Uncharacterized protein n=1 Tax=Triticum turgidum subsp. durum TaxID=4567 RepID=A0A9R0VUA5_TRITD|nr:unnamed protein product [Triticum turgidum subsp. durum]